MNTKNILASLTAWSGFLMGLIPTIVIIANNVFDIPLDASTVESLITVVSAAVAEVVAFAGLVKGRNRAANTGTQASIF